MITDNLMKASNPTQQINEKMKKSKKNMFWVSWLRREKPPPVENLVGLHLHLQYCHYQVSPITHLVPPQPHSLEIPIFP